MDNNDLRRSNGVLQDAEADVWFRGNANDLLLMATGKKEPGTLFQYLQVLKMTLNRDWRWKNLMDAIEPDAMPVLLRMRLQLMPAGVEAGLTQDATAQAARAGVPC